MAKLSPLMILPPVVFLGLAALFYTGMGREGQNELPSTREGSPAPGLRLVALGAKPELAEADLRAGGVKLVNYWASWCAPCRVEHPQLVALAQQGVQVYGINYKDDPAKALAFLEELGDPYAKIGADAEGRTALDWGVYGVPETYVLDAKGTIILRFAGPITSKALTDTLLPAIEKAKAE